MVTLAAAEASGVARWCLDTAVEYAGLREQFGQKIGAFQAIKHLCAEMLETSESVTAAAWDAARAATDDDPAQQEFAALVAGTICFDGAVSVAKSCIQVLGGIGFTFEHDAHLYLRRALALRSMVGPTGQYAAGLADLAATDLGGWSASTWPVPKTSAPRSGSGHSGSPSCPRMSAAPPWRRAGT